MGIGLYRLYRGIVSVSGLSLEGSESETLMSFLVPCYKFVLAVNMLPLTHNLSISTLCCFIQPWPLVNATLLEEGPSREPEEGRGGRGIPASQRISPIAIASPSSPASDESGPSLNSSLHSSRFTFKRRLNKLLISALIMIIFSEGEDEQASSDEESGDQLPSQNDSASQSSLAEDTLKASATVHEEEGPGEAGIQLDPPQENFIVCEPANRYANVLYPVLPPGVNLMDIEDGVMIDWKPTLDKAHENAIGESQQA